MRNHLPGGPLGEQTIFISDFWPPEGWEDKHLLFEAWELGVICYSRSRKPVYQGKWWYLRGWEGTCPGPGKGLGRKPAPPIRASCLSACGFLRNRDCIVHVSAHRERWPVLAGGKLKRAAQELDSASGDKILGGPTRHRPWMGTDKSRGPLFSIHCGSGTLPESDTQPRLSRKCVFKRVYTGIHTYVHILSHTQTAA